jgi:hypothetical protein
MSSAAFPPPRLVIASSRAITAMVSATRSSNFSLLLSPFSFLSRASTICSDGSILYHVPLIFMN